jgi:hypothetical protein
MKFTVANDPAGELTMGLIAVAWGIGCVLFPRYITLMKFFSSRQEPGIGVGFLRFCGGVIALGGLQVVAVSAWYLWTHR